MIIAEFSCREQNCNTYILGLDRGHYTSVKKWFNIAKPTFTQEEFWASLDFSDVVHHFLNSANLALDTTKDYNSTITDEQKKSIVEAIEHVKHYAKSIGAEVNP